MTVSVTPHISAVICTHNRSAYLANAIQSLCQQTLSCDLFEILVVDNASTDDTQALVSRMADQNRFLKYVYEPILGLSHARNTGWKMAQGDYIAYLDDDAIADPHWLEKILITFETISWQPGVICGRVDPCWEGERPDWLVEEFWSWFSALDWSDQPLVLENQYFCGTNMALPRELLQRIGGFSINLGRKGKILLSNEELLLQHQIHRLGYVTYYHPDISVKHYIPRHRQTKQWLFQRIFSQGISDAIMLFCLDLISKPQHIHLIFEQISRVWRTKLNQFLNLPHRGQDDLTMLKKRQEASYQLGYLWGLLVAFSHEK